MILNFGLNYNPMCCEKVEELKDKSSVVQFHKFIANGFIFIEKFQ